MSETATVILSIVAALLLAFAVATAASLAAARPLSVLCIGDSITSGSGYPERLADATGWQVANAGIPGATSAGIRDRLSVALARHRYDAIVICAGINDTNPADTARNLGAMVDLCERYGTRCLVLTYAGTHERAPRLNAISRALPCGVLDFAATARPGHLQADGVHLAPAGARALAELVMRHNTTLGSFGVRRAPVVCGAPSGAWLRPGRLWLACRVREPLTEHMGDLGEPVLHKEFQHD